MKQHPKMTPEIVLAKMRTPPDGAMEKDGKRISVQEDADAKEALIRITQDPSHVSVHCIGCGGSCVILESACCVCGGFVCPACLRVETEGVCEHQTFMLPDAALDLPHLEGDEHGISFGIESDGPPPTPETLTIRQALDLIDKHMEEVDLHSTSRLNPFMTKYDALKILLNALDPDHMDELVGKSQTRILLARNILIEVGLAH